MVSTYRPGEAGDRHRSPLASAHGEEAGVYVVSVAAELAGVHPQTLRVYERRRLLEPTRTAGGTRRYSDADLARVQHIGELTRAGVNIEGVRRILELEAELAAVTAELERARRAESSARPTIPRSAPQRDEARR